MKGAHDAGKRHHRGRGNSAADVFVFAALNQEFEALVSRMKGNLKEWAPTTTSPYLFVEGELALPGASRLLRYVVGTPDDVGTAAAQDLTHHALSRFRPRYVLQSGISAGVRESVELGDIIVADQIVDYSMGKKTALGLQHHHRVWPSCRYLRGIAAMLRTKGMKGTSWLSTVNGKPQVHIGTVATGSYVLADGETIQDLRKDWPKLLGVEMEAGGILSALHSAGLQDAFLMVKAVSDFADQEKNDDARKEAYEHSAAFTFALLKRFEAIVNE